MKATEAVGWVRTVRACACVCAYARIGATGVDAHLGDDQQQVLLLGQTD
jgi:hypothetical protein